MATTPQQMQAEADMARAQQNAAQQAQAMADMARQTPPNPYMPPTATPGGGVTSRGAPIMAMKKGGKVKKMASGGKASSASKRADGIAQRGKTKGRMI